MPFLKFQKCPVTYLSNSSFFHFLCSLFWDLYTFLRFLRSFLLLLFALATCPLSSFYLLSVSFLPFVLHHPHFLSALLDVLSSALSQLSPFPSTGFKGLSRNNLRAVASQELLGGQIGSRRFSSSSSFLSREGSRLERACKPDYLMSLQKLMIMCFGAAE